jgi:hypothetical protein
MRPPLIRAYLTFIPTSQALAPNTGLWTLHLTSPCEQEKLDASLIRQSRAPAESKGPKGRKETPRPSIVTVTSAVPKMSFLKTYSEFWLKIKPRKQR